MANEPIIQELEEIIDTGPTIKSKLAKLIDVKSITTFAFVGAFIASVFLDKANPELSEITRTIVIFFFGSKYGAAEAKGGK